MDEPELAIEYFDDALDIIVDLIEQHCWSGDHKNPELDSGFLTANANAMRFLSEHGRFKINDEYARWVSGTVIEP